MGNRSARAVAAEAEVEAEGDHTLAYCNRKCCSFGCTGRNSSSNLSADYLDWGKNQSHRA